MHCRQAGTSEIYIRLFGRKTTKCLVIHGVYTRFWPTLVIYTRSMVWLDLSVGSRRSV
jgi:hypothetical protein